VSKISGRLLGEMQHDECAPWCDHNPENHHINCTDSFCPGGGTPYYKTEDGLLMGDCFWFNAI